MLWLPRTYWSTPWCKARPSWWFLTFLTVLTRCSSCTFIMKTSWCAATTTPRNSSSRLDYCLWIILSAMTLPVSRHCSFMSFDYIHLPFHWTSFLTSAKSAAIILAGLRDGRRRDLLLEHLFTFQYLCFHICLSCDSNITTNFALDTIIGPPLQLSSQLHLLGPVSHIIHWALHYVRIADVFIKLCLCAISDHF